MSDYQLPEVWKAPSQMGGAWGGLNQPTAGARFEQTLPKGDQPFQLYTLPTPNGIKATIMLEELKELGVDAGYDAYRLDTGGYWLIQRYEWLDRLIDPTWLEFSSLG